MRKSSPVTTMKSCVIGEMQLGQGDDGDLAAAAASPPAARTARRPPRSRAAPSGALRQREAQVELVFRARFARCGQRIGQRERRRAPPARSRAARVGLAAGARRRGRASTRRAGAQREEVQAVGEPQHAGAQVDRFHLHRLQHLFIFDEAAVHLAVGRDQPVDAEVAVVGHVAEIAAIGEPLAALRAVPAQAMIDPLPDAPAGRRGYL